MLKYLVAFLLFAAPALAGVPRVSTDIAPVHGLASRVMAGLGTPDLLVPPAASPHDFALRPSQAGALQEADLVIWVGSGLTPWLARTLDSLPGGKVMELNALPRTRLLAWRGEDDHGHGHDHGHDHADKGAVDPHSWLDPENARLWTTAIAGALAAMDPENAVHYHRNAEEARAEIDRAAAEAKARLAPHRGAPYLVFHDAYHYFEAHFDLHAAGSVAQGDSAAPGPGRIRALRQQIAEQGIACLFAEPQFSAGLIDTLAEGSEARIGVLDPLGNALPAGPGFYPALITAMAETMADCLQGD